jgi:hypothetical protein
VGAVPAWKNDAAFVLAIPFIHKKSKKSKIYINFDFFTTWAIG